MTGPFHPTVLVLSTAGSYGATSWASVNAATDLLVVDISSGVESGSVVGILRNDPYLRAIRVLVPSGHGLDATRPESWREVDRALEVLDGTRVVWERTCIGEVREGHVPVDLRHTYTSGES